MWPYTIFITRCGPIWSHLIVVFDFNGLNKPKCDFGDPWRNMNYSVSYEIMSHDHLHNVCLVITSHLFILNRFFAINGWPIQWRASSLIYNFGNNVRNFQGCVLFKQPILFERKKIMTMPSFFSLRIVKLCFSLLLLWWSGFYCVWFPWYWRCGWGVNFLCKFHKIDYSS